ncbi:UDP-N-acetylmuramate dehydrogenase [Fodinibius salsisoli]|uniref:UDP-N-acetylenolpyruvoylglucosamine reductase n=1 Tax=Fodinibius salsisoli TaxID=2820877 RepID=A0ABT3PLH5_9BACT|nr:UDP-N-acetylmuramate dehydrogenase [Fodinibius salsisoli]MCW9706803.1 UDP-N-acetylmuramate dehydrogenase [Fodinibius salsisoli]
MSKSIDETVQHDVELRPYNTLNISARAQSFVSIHSIEQLQDILKKKDRHEDIFVLGGGSNILFANDYNGLVLKVAIEGKKVIRETDQHLWLEVGAGENWHQTVQYAVERGWGGIENLSLIPGTVGAAPIQNIGAYGVELKDVFEKLQAVEIATGEVHTFNNEQCQFGYRDSIFKGKLKEQYVITRVVLKLNKKPVLNTSYGAIQAEIEERKIERPTIRDISDIVIDIRNSKLPHPDTLGNAGSFFKNPVIDVDQYERLKESFAEVPGYRVNEHRIKVPAGWLIEETGWKGKVVGDAGTYKQQALVIVNHGEASAADILSLAEAIQDAVKEQFGIKLVPEVNIIG